MMKKAIIVFLIFVSILICDLNIVHAADDNFSDIYVVGMDGKNAGEKQRYSIIQKSNDVMFSGEDLSKISGYTYSVKQNEAIFKRGYKEIKINLSNNTYTVITAAKRLTFDNKIINKDGIYYFSAAEMLPWLNVGCVVDKGIIYVDVDENSYWDIYEDFNNSKWNMVFDFEECCRELGESSKELSAMSYLKDESLVGIILDHVWIPGTSTTVGVNTEYIEIFEEMFEDSERINETIDEMVDGSEGIKAYLELADSVEGLADLSEEIKFLDGVTKELKILEDAENFLSYLCLLEKDNTERMMWLEYLVSRKELSASEQMISAAQEVITLYDNDVRFTDYGKKILYAMADNVVDAVIDKVTGAGTIKKVLGLMDLYTATNPDWVSGVNKISKYDQIAQEGLMVYVLESDKFDTKAIESQRSHAMLFLYSSECNWRVMADYAKTRNYELSKVYTEIAEEAETWQAKMLLCAKSTVNDSLGYGTNNDDKTEYINALKNKFSNMNIKDDNSETPENNENNEATSNLIRVSYYDGDGKLKYYFEYKYEDGNAIEELHYEEDGDLSSWKERKYDEKGNYIREKEFDSDGELIYDIKFTYDSSGNCVREKGTDQGASYEVEREYNEYNHLITEVEKCDGKIDYYVHRKLEYDAKGNPLKITTYDMDDEIMGTMEIKYDSNNNIVEIIEYSSSGEVVKKTNSEYDSDSKLLNTVYNDIKYGTVTEETYNEHGHVYKRILYNENGNILEEKYSSFVYDSKGNIRSEVSYDDEGCVSQIQYDYSTGVDLKSVVVNNYWYQYEPTIGGYTRYKFFEDGTYQSLWIVDYVNNNQVVTGNYKIEGDEIILDGYSAFSSYYNEQINVFADETFVPIEVNPINGGMYLDIIISTDKYYEEYSDEMIKYLDSILHDKREQCINNN